MYDIKGRYYLQIKIDGKFLSLDNVTLKSISMVSNIEFGFPTAEIELSDSIRYFDSYPLLDGSKIEISAGVDESDSNKKSYSFRVFSIKQQEISHTINYKITCTMNAPRYINENYKGAFRGTSSEAIRFIADTCGLKSDVDTSTDSQVWYGIGEKRYIFAQHIAKASYLNTTSFYKLGLTIDGTLKLKNVSQIAIANSRNLFVQGNKISAKVFSVLGSEESTKSGLLNNIAGYKLEAIEQLPNSYVVHDKIEFPLKTSTLNINKNLNEKLSGSALAVYPVNTDNVNSNFYRGSYQNIRTSATYGNNLFITVNQETNLDLFDPIKYAMFDNINGMPKLNTKLSGGYIITGKSIYIVPGYYYEKFMITRQGYNLSTFTSGDKKILGIE